MDLKRKGDIIDLTIPACAEYIGVVRLLVSGVANRLGFSYDDIEDIKLAVAEACTNAVLHAYPQGEEGDVRIRCLVFPDRLQILVADKGTSFDVDRVKTTLGPIDGTVDIAHQMEGGLGLYLIHTLMDEVDISGGEGIVVAMTKYVRWDEVADSVDPLPETRQNRQ